MSDEDEQTVARMTRSLRAHYAIFGQLDDVTIPVAGPPWVMAHERAAGTSRREP